MSLHRWDISLPSSRNDVRCLARAVDTGRVVLVLALLLSVGLPLELA